MFRYWFSQFANVDGQLLIPKLYVRAVFIFECRLLRYVIGLKDSRHFFIQSEVKPKPIVTRSHTFSRALRQLHVITSSFDWFTVLSVFFVIG